jgi:hypothetical protein
MAKEQSNVAASFQAEPDILESRIPIHGTASIFRVELKYS